MRDKMFTYAEYLQILNLYSDRIKSFKEAVRASEFVILRHDVEFSLNRAFKIAKIEKSKGIKSTFFFQVLSNAYNPFSNQNYNTIQKISQMGHSVGLHAYISHIENGDTYQLDKELVKQKTMFEHGLNLECVNFSFHRPPKWVLEIRKDEICDMVNAYGPSFFEFSSQPKNIIYLSDSKHNWSYGHPLAHKEKDKMQILVHPDEWTEAGDDSLVEFFNGLKSEQKVDFENTLNNENKNYAIAFGLDQ